LKLTWHNRDPECGIQKLTTIPKTFREKSSYAAIILSFWRWVAFLIVLFRALLVVAEEIADSGGTNLTGIVNLDPTKALIHLTICFETLAYLHLAHAFLAFIHAMPIVRSPATVLHAPNTCCKTVCSCRAMIDLPVASSRSFEA
jgi:hypothetical protein